MPGMGGKLVTFATDYQTVSAVQDLIGIKLAAAQFAFLHSARIVQSSDEASSESEILKIAIKRGAGSTSGSGGGTATEILGFTGQSASGVTEKERNNTTQITGGTLEVLKIGGFQVLSGEWEYTPVPELRHPFFPSEFIVLALEEAPADALTLAAEITLEIYG